MEFEELNECTLCPRNCKVNRNEEKNGFCRTGKNVKVALCSLHYYEEPSISGEAGSGTVFFTGCNLRCVFCQNYKVSQELEGKEITIEELANEFLALQEKGANNINLVTGFMYVPHIIEALKIAKEKGLKVPVVYNSSGYESTETLKLLEGFVDVYLPDLKYYYDDLGKKFSGVDNYFEKATEAIYEMYRQVGSPEFDENGMIKRGLIIRHLVLPNNIDNSKKVLKWIKDNIDDDVYVSVMAQYFPTHKAKDNKELKLDRKISKEEYDEIENYVFELDLNGYMQDYDEGDESKYVPNFEQNANK